MNLLWTDIVSINILFSLLHIEDFDKHDFQHNTETGMAPIFSIYVKFYAKRKKNIWRLNKYLKELKTVF